jgi:hypothetical protein
MSVYRRTKSGYESKIGAIIGKLNQFDRPRLLAWTCAGWLGRSFARIRRKKRLTQEQKEELSGFSQQYISGLERSCRKVGRNWCSGISDGMRLSLHAARSMH